MDEEIHEEDRIFGCCSSAQMMFDVYCVLTVVL